MHRWVCVSNMAKYQVRVLSCRKDTILTYDFSEDEALLMQHIASLTQQQSKSECEPTLHVTKVKKITVNGVEG